jgi:hypothetical protein
VEAAEAREAAQHAGGHAAPGGVSGTAAAAAPSGYVAPPLPHKPAPPPKPRSSPPASAAVGTPPPAAPPHAATFDAFGEFASAPTPAPPLFSPSLGAPPPLLSVDLFDPQPRTSASAAHTPNLLDLPSPSPAPPVYDPYGIAAAAETPGPLNAMSPLAVALPRVSASPLPVLTPSRDKLGEAAKKSNDPFASLTGL